MLEKLQSIHNMCQKYLENYLEAQELIWLSFEKSFFWRLTIKWFFQSAQKKDFSKESQRSSWASKSFSKYFWHMLWILFRFSNIRTIEWWQFQNHDRHRLHIMTGNWPCYRFLQIEAWNACRIFYSLGLTRPLQVSKKIFETFFQKSASTVLSGLIWSTD